jgi:hypothetical protein
MMHIDSFNDLVVWQVSMDLVDVRFDIVEKIRHPYRFLFADQLFHLVFRAPRTSLQGVAVRQRPTSITFLDRMANSKRSSKPSVGGRVVPDALLTKGTRLAEPVGKMLHGLSESLELRLRSES